MLNTVDFATCVRENLKARRYGKERADEIVKEFEARQAFHKSIGQNDVNAGMLAMKDVFDGITMRTQEAAKRTAAMLGVQATNGKVIRDGVNAPVSLFLMDGKRGSQGVAVARAAVSLIEDDPRFPTISYSSRVKAVHGQLHAMFDDVLSKVGKGAFGRQKGKAHLPNIIMEAKGTRTGDVAARDFWLSWQKIQDVAVDLFNEAGGSMKKLKDYIPQPGANVAKMTKAGPATWIRDHMAEGVLDWDKIRWPDGSEIPANERVQVLEQVYRTQSTNGASKIDASAFRGQGRALGNQLDQHRFLHYKTGKGWMDIHAKYGDGSVFDVFERHIQHMAHEISLVRTFGPNPEMTAQNMRAMVRKEASKLSPQDQSDAEAVMNNKFDKMFETITRQNAMDPNSNFAAAVTGTQNILTSAMLGSASFLAIPGDFMQAAAVRALNKMGMFGGVDFYFKSIATDRKFMAEIANQSGFVHDETVMANYATTRFTGIATNGPAVTRHVSETVMRASLLSGHTKAARWATQAEFMGLMYRSREMTWDKLPFRDVFSRYGIKAEEWDALRNNVKPWEPRKDVKFMRPIDILQSELPNKQVLYEKFQSAIFEEARKMVPEATVEGAVSLKDTTRPDTMVGALLSSFAMYKNFPISFMMVYGRLGMMAPKIGGNAKLGKLAFFAGLGAGMVLVGAMGRQMRAISQGKEPEPMDNPAFMGKALLSGGALGIWGDFLTAGINEFGRGPQDVVAGPLVSFVGDTTDLVAGDVFNWANSVGSLGDGDFKAKFPAKAVEYMRRYTPGTSLWWARLALEREVWDRLQVLADPKAYQKQQRKARRLKQTQGNGYWSPPGQSLIGN